MCGVTDTLGRREDSGTLGIVTFKQKIVIGNQKPTTPVITL